MTKINKKALALLIIFMSTNLTSSLHAEAWYSTLYKKIEQHTLNNYNKAIEKYKTVSNFLKKNINYQTFTKTNTRLALSITAAAGVSAAIYYLINQAKKTKTKSRPKS